VQQLGFIGALPGFLVLAFVAFAFDVLPFVWYDWDRTLLAWIGTSCAFFG
jgi:hypothetical protein